MNKSFMVVIYFWMAVFGPLLSAATTIPPAVSFMPCAQWKLLLQHRSGKIPDVLPLWEWTKQDHIEDVFLGGGVLRGLILETNKDLAAHGVKAAWEGPVRKSVELLIQKPADRDLYGPDNLRFKILERPGFETWDVLTQSFFEDSVKDRGATVDKIRLSPTQIDDPFAALDALCGGKLEFRTDGPPFQQKGGKSLGGHSWLMLALRHLRLVADFKEIAEGDPSAQKSIRALAEQKADWIPTNMAHDLESPIESADRFRAAYLIRKALEKLYRGVNEDPVELIQILVENGLLPLLAEKFYNVYSFIPEDLDSAMSRGLRAGVSFPDFWKFAKMQTLERVGAAMTMHRALLKHAATSAETILALTPFWETPNRDYQNQLRILYEEFAAQNANRAIEFAPGDLTRLERACNLPRGMVALKKLALRSAKTGEEALRILAPVWSDPHADYLNAIQELAVAVKPDLMALPMTPAERLVLGHVLNAPVEEAVAGFQQRLSSPCAASLRRNSSGWVSE